MDLLALQTTAGGSAFELLKEFLAGKSDRALVIAGAARVDDALKEMLRSFLAPPQGSTDDLLDGDSPLGSFSSRVRIAYRLRLIDESIVQACNLIRKIRNTFAHEAETPTIESGPQKQRLTELLLILSAFRASESAENLRKLDWVGAVHADAVTFTVCVASVTALIKSVGAVARPLPDNTRFR